MDYNSADLTSVLRTLSALSNQQQQPPPPPPPAIATIQNNATQSHKLEQQAAAAAKEEQENDPYEPSESLPHISVAPTPAPAPTAPTAPSTPSQTQSHHPNTASSQPSHGNRTTEDTSTITTWPTALRYVMRTVAQNESIQQRIRWLMQRQYDHEKQWWQGREALLRKQASRIEKKKELDAVLRSVGAPVDENKQISTAEEDRAELTNYDAKVYKASKQMSEAMGAELRALRIPFFTIKKNLVSEHTTRSPGAARQHSGNHHDPGKQLIFLSRDELSTLQLRMLELLQDLCRE